MKKNVFNSKMALFDDSIESLADHLEISRQSLAEKRDGRSQFKQDEMTKIMIRWQLTPEEVVDMFLSKGD